jgi:hypothetical protein
MITSGGYDTHTSHICPVLPRYFSLLPLQFASGSQLASALQQLVVLMVSRYSCSLQQDQQLLQQKDSLAPRLAAAVTARIGEKEVWAELQQVRGAVGLCL